MTAGNGGEDVNEEPGAFDEALERVKRVADDEAVGVRLADEAVDHHARRMDDEEGDFHFPLIYLKMLQLVKQKSVGGSWCQRPETFFGSTSMKGYN